MKFQNNNGTGIVAIHLDLAGSYFRFLKPLATTWLDNKDTSAMFLCQLPYDKAYRDAISDQLSFSLNNDYTGREEELKQLVRPLLPLFPAGELGLHFYNSPDARFFEHHYFINGFANITYLDWDLVFTHVIVDLSERMDKIIDYEEATCKHTLTKPGPIIDYTTGGYYDNGGRLVIATQPQNVVDESRVKYFETQIRQGERPFAILFNCQYIDPAVSSGQEHHDRSMASPWYILDGHHTLLAYKNLGIKPAIAEITHYPISPDEVKFNFDELSSVLFPWQVMDIKSIASGWR